MLSKFAIIVTNGIVIVSARNNTTVLETIANIPDTVENIKESVCDYFGYGKYADFTTDKSWDTESLKELFANTGGYIRTGEDERDIAANPNVDPTYGTILVEGMDKMIAHLNIDKNDTFLDLGCGVGNVVATFACRSDVKRSRGIEYLKSRYEKACNLIKDVEKVYEEKTGVKNLNEIKSVNVKNGDIYEEDINDASIIFACSTCFPEELMTAITKKCEENKNLKYFITLRRIWDETSLEYLGSFSTPCSWDKDDDVTRPHVYTNRGATINNPEPEPEYQFGDADDEYTNVSGNTNVSGPYGEITESEL